MQQDERAAQDAYLGAGIRKAHTDSSLLMSTSRWLNNGSLREILMTWLLRKNGPDFPVEADHTLGLQQAIGQVMPDAEVEALMAEEYKINPTFRAWIDEGFITTLRNEDYFKFAPGTVGGIIGRQIKDFGFDLTLGVDVANLKKPDTLLGFWRMRTRQIHDFEHILVGGQFNSIGEIVVIFAKAANTSVHLSPKLAQAMNVYLLFSGMRMVSRSLLHYPETWPKALECLEQGISVGRASGPIYAFNYDEVLHMTPEEARKHMGVHNAYEVQSEAEAAIFREDPPKLATAAE